MQPTAPKGEIMSLMPYASDPEGVYECIERASQFGIPIYVSETGFPTFNDDHMRIVLDRYIKEVSIAMAAVAFDCRCSAEIRLCLVTQNARLYLQTHDCNWSHALTSSK